MHEHGGVFCKTGNSGLIGKSFNGEKTWIGPNLVGPKVHRRGGGAAHPGPRPGSGVGLDGGSSAGLGLGEARSPREQE